MVHFYQKALCGALRFSQRMVSVTGVFIKNNKVFSYLVQSSKLIFFDHIRLHNISPLLCAITLQ
uniref:Uncharacterized protein n=1 Tax=Anguilla anguilla TaxID=7936 RepID=A0A0E9XK19_ANGAN